MPPIVYIIAVIALASFGSGVGITRHFDQGEIVSMKMAIEQANSQSAAVLVAAKTRVEKAQSEAVSANNELESANAQSITTINYYHSALANTRLRDPGATRCSNTMPVSHNTQEPANSAADDGTLSDEAEKFLREESYRADQIRVYAQECYKFVVENNCGIQK